MANPHRFESEISAPRHLIDEAAASPATPGTGQLVLAGRAQANTKDHYLWVKDERGNEYRVIVNGEASQQDLQRVRGESLRWFRQKLARRSLSKRQTILPDVANIWTLGDSVMEGFGNTSDYDVFMRATHWAIQRTFRSGGFGFVPAGRGIYAAGSTAGWSWTTNPDGLYTWAYGGTGNTFNTGDSSGWGYGRLAVSLSGTGGGGGSATISGECDSVWVHYLRFNGSTFQVDVDLGTPFAQQFTFSPNVASGDVESGGIYEITGLPLGVHTFKITSQGTAITLEGITFFSTDRLVGVHMFHGAHSGYTSAHFKGDVALSRQWADIGIQPHTRIEFAAAATGNGTTTLVVTGASFTALDIGEFIWSNPLDNTLKIPLGARIASVTNGTTVVLDQVAPSNSNFNAHMNRSNVTVTTVSGDRLLTVTSGTLDGACTGKLIQGPTSIPANTRILEVLTPTTATMSQPATASQSAQTCRIVNRVLVNTKPDLIIIELGYNDQIYGIGEASYKANITATVSNAIKRAHCEHTPSILLMSLHAPGVRQDLSGNVVTTNGSALISINLADGNGGLSFGSEDVGRTITTASNTPIPAGTTIASVQDETHATLSQNAVATSAAAYATVVGKLRSDRYWVQNEHKWMQELAELNGWGFMDLHNIMGWIGDPNLSTWNDRLLTIDGIHYTDWASHMVTDALNLVLSGTPENSAIDAGRFDNKGDSIWGAGADQPVVLAPGVDGQAVIATANADRYGRKAGVQFVNAMSVRSRYSHEWVNNGATTYTDIGFPTASQPADVGTSPQIANADIQWGPAATLTTKAATPASGDAAGRKSGAFTHLDPRWMPEFFCSFYTPGSIASLRYWFGLFSAAPEAASSPTASLAAFRYDTGADTAGYWTTCTKDGTTLKTNLGAAPILAGTYYELRIVTVGVKGNNPTAYEFYVNDKLIAVHTANLPANTKTLGAQLSVTTLTGATKNFTLFKWAVGF